MSKKDVVKPGHFKLAGRSRKGQDISPELEKQKYTKTEESATEIPSPQTSNKSGVQSTARKLDTASSGGFEQQPSSAQVPGAFGKQQEKDSATRKGRLKTKHAGGSE